jgi:hypothetical protein
MRNPEGDKEADGRPDHAILNGKDVSWQSYHKCSDGAQKWPLAKVRKF